LKTHLPDRRDVVIAFQRSRLCNLETAGAVANQITETSGRATVIIRTQDAIQPYRIAYFDEADIDASVIAEIHTAADAA
jgi:hypothetical protein